MAEGTKERILRIALELFAQNGYLGTSMNDIARQVGLTKAALYKHYASKQEILDKIVERMNKMDFMSVLKRMKCRKRNQTALQKHICIHQFKRFARTVLHNLTIGQRSHFPPISVKC